MGLNQSWNVKCDHPTCTIQVRDFSTDNRALAYVARVGWYVRKPEGLGRAVTLCPWHLPKDETVLL